MNIFCLAALLLALIKATSVPVMKPLYRRNSYHSRHGHQTNPKTESKVRNNVQNQPHFEQNTAHLN